MARKCIFCGARPVVTEHVFPSWLNKVTPGSGRWEHTTTQIDPEGTSFSFDRVADAVEVTVKRTCVTCNSGWMSALESQVKDALIPAIQGKQGTVFAGLDLIATIGAWATKTALMIELAWPGRNQHPAIPDSDYAEFYRQRAPFPDSHVLAAGYHPDTGQDWRAAWGAPRKATFHLSSGRDAHGYLVAFSIGHLVFHVFRRPEETAIQLGAPARTVFVQLWPINRLTVPWPGETILDTPGLDKSLSLLL